MPLSLATVGYGIVFTRVNVPFELTENSSKKTGTEGEANMAEQANVAFALLHIKSEIPRFVMTEQFELSTALMHESVGPTTHFVPSVPKQSGPQQTSPQRGAGLPAFFDPVQPKYALGVPNVPCRNATRFLEFLSRDF